MAPSAHDKAMGERAHLETRILYLETEVATHTATPLAQPYVKILIENAKTCQFDLDDIQNRIILTTPPDIGPYNTVYHVLMKKILMASASLQEIIGTFPGGSGTTTGTSSTSSDVRLPRLELPTFDGTIQDWVSFRDVFTSAIHNKTTISKSQKLTYLKGQLKGDAERQIASLCISDSNYDIAWDQLSNRYQNDRLLFFSIVNRLHDQPSVERNSSKAIHQLIDTTQECIRSLKALKISTDQLDCILLFFLYKKMDGESKQMWEQTLKGSEIPPVKDLFEFLEQRARALAAKGDTVVSKVSTQGPRQKSSKPMSHHVQSKSNATCKFCDQPYHQYFRCIKFTEWSVQERTEAVKRLKLCYNCLSDSHQLTNCPSNKTCKQCSRKHHSLLHWETRKSTSASTSNQDSTPKVHFTAGSTLVDHDTILGTAVVHIKDRFGRPHPVRALVDNGCNTHFISDSLATKLSLPRTRCHASATGLGEEPVGTSTSYTRFTVSPHFNQNVSFSISRCLITNKITSKLPSNPFNHKKWSHLQVIPLADPDFHTPADVDMLLGAEFFFAVIGHGKESGPPSSPVALNTSFGWLIGGGSPEELLHPSKVHTTLASSETSTTTNCDHSKQLEALDKTLRNFWEVEAEPTERIMTKEEQAAEDHFKSTYRRDENGKFICKLPLKSSAPNLGSSLTIAVKRLQYLERRLSRNPHHKEEYSTFMQEYEELGHMKEVLPPSPEDTSRCYIPHHFVLKESSTSTKFRVVFDASAKTSNGVSLNSTMMVGPTIQDPLYDILIRFRNHKIAFTADIAKMYRQILIDPDDNPQYIIWRETPTSPIKHFLLQTVTYGTGSAPFLATRTLHEIAFLERHRFPIASQVATRDFYVDDVMSGEPTVKEAISTQSQLIQLMNSAGMDLRKWSSNSQEFLDSLPMEMRETKSLLSFESDTTIKALGILWNPQTDQFIFKLSPISKINNCNFQNSLTKRMVLSQMASLFDPVGWLAPLIINAKIYMQSIWKLKQDWDEEIPPELQEQWHNFCDDLQGLNNLNIDRCYLSSTSFACPSLNSPFIPNPIKFHLAGFCDASQKAYAAVVYLCAYDDFNSFSSTLVTSKTRVAPIKEISLPRLELCGALLLAKLIPATTKALKLPIQSIKAFTDSTITLAWIQASSSKWETFVANRVTKIQELIPFEDWSHVPGEENPADCASRGIDYSTFSQHPLWWHGPQWLSSWPPQSPSSEAFSHLIIANESFITEEISNPLCHATISKENESFLNRYSSLLKLSRVTAFVLRFIKNCRVKRSHPDVPKFKLQIKDIVYTHPLTAQEIQSATLHWVKIVQEQAFSTELRTLKKGLPLLSSNPLRHLRPFFDETGLLRVGGRLKNSPMSHERRFPILLPYSSVITHLIIDQEHTNHFHAGPQLLLSNLQRRYWIIRGKDAVRHFIRKCVTCTRHKAITMQQVMADLPFFRVTPARPFSKCGVDYAGPFQIKSILPRSKTTLKAWIAVFVCPVTRAIHLEVVSSLSTDAFLATLRRFISRRGKPTDIYSDCGTNFVGANHEMKELLRLVLSSNHNQKMSDELSKLGTNWHFNPPAAPHHGGLWEAGVKSMKYHLRRIMGTHRLTFEELTTATCQIEAILNSRPLTQESSDPDDLTALTPGHFLVAGPLTAIPEPTLEDINQTHLSRWQLLQQMTQSFWRRWSSEYLTRLQQRPKWMTEERHIAVGDLVLIKDDNLPPLHWRLGRVIIVHPGKDSIPRVVTLKTQQGEVKRPIVKLCLLPVNSNSKNDILP